MKKHQYATECEIDKEITSCMKFISWHRQEIAQLKKHIQENELKIKYLQAIKIFLKRSICPFVKLNIYDASDVERFALPLINKKHP